MEELKEQITNLEQRLGQQQTDAFLQQETQRREAERSKRLRDLNDSRLERLIFTGTEDPGEFEKFWEKLKWQHHVLGLQTDAEKIRYFASALHYGTPSFRFFNELTDAQRNNWTTVENQFRDRFASTDTKYTAMMKLPTMTQGAEETTNSFLNRLQETSKIAFPNPGYTDEQRTEQVITNFLRGTHDKISEYFAMNQRPDTIAELIKKANAIESALKKRNLRAPTDLACYTAEPVEYSREELQKELAEMVNSSLDARMEQLAENMFNMDQWNPHHQQQWYLPTEHVHQESPPWNLVPPLYQNWWNGQRRSETPANVQQQRMDPPDPELQSRGYGNGGYGTRENEWNYGNGGFGGNQNFNAMETVSNQDTNVWQDQNIVLTTELAALREQNARLLEHIYGQGTNGEAQFYMLEPVTEDTTKDYSWIFA